MHFDHSRHVLMSFIITSHSNYTISSMYKLQNGATLQILQRTIRNYGTYGAIK